MAPRARVPLAAAGCILVTTLAAAHLPGIGVGDDRRAAAGEQRSVAETRRAAATPAAMPAALPPVPPGADVHVRIVVQDRVVAIDDGVAYRAWTFNGRPVGPALHVRQGQRVHVTFTNRGSVPHSLDFHSARTPADRDFRDVAPGDTLRYSFTAGDPGAYMYHCVTAPAVSHVANGMYGAIVVEPRRPLPPVDREFVLVASEWYLDGDGRDEAAAYDHADAMRMQPQVTTFNGVAHQYAERPLRVPVGSDVRFHVVNAGPNLPVAFHVVGGVFDRVYPEGDMSGPLHDIQTSEVPPGGGATFDLALREAGYYPLVNHSFAVAQLGQVAMVQVGQPSTPKPVH